MKIWRKTNSKVKNYREEYEFKNGEEWMEELRGEEKP